MPLSKERAAEVVRLSTLRLRAFRASGQEFLTSCLMCERDCTVLHSAQKCKFSIETCPIEARLTRQ
jgi:hypothetical protein